MTASSRPQPKPGILEIAPYVPGASKIAGRQMAVKLSSNESAFGPSPRALEAYHQTADDIGVYAPGDAGTLRAAIAQCHGLDADRIVCGNGSDELLALLATGYLGTGDNAVITEHAFLLYRIVSLMNSATVRVAPKAGFQFDPDLILDQVTPRTRIVFVTNPDNPTGSYLSSGQMRRLLTALRKDVLLVIDGAYAEYATADDFEDGLGLADAHDNVVITRTFSKVYGLAGLRIGWAYCPKEVADVLHRIRGPFNVNTAAQAAGIAAVRDGKHMESVRQQTADGRALLTEKLSALGLTVNPSQGNFLLVRFPHDTPRSAGAADEHLKSNGYIVRAMTSYGLPDCLRITIGRPEQNQAIADLLADFMQDKATASSP